MNTPKVIETCLLFIMILAVQNVCAQKHLERTANDNSAAAWYGGIEGGVPFGVSTFSSFEADKTRSGYALGLFGGYRFNPVLSAELTAKWGKTNLSARDCCTEVATGWGLTVRPITHPWQDSAEPTMPT